MKLWMPAVAVIAPLLAGCGDTSTDTGDIAGVQVERDSEACRALAASGVAVHGVDNVESAAQKQARYDRVYQGCMAAKGYSPTSAS